MCWYANYKEEKAKADLVTQQAEYYKHLYEFHSQMEAEMVAMQNFANAKNGGATHVVGTPA